MAVAKTYEVWEIRWTRREYGGPSFGVEPSYHLTREEAESYRKRREGDRSVWPPEDPFYYDGSEPSLKIVGKAERERMQIQQ
ncbi:MAG TPA: hypothetical protein VN176_18300 [Verrucomicrobiae bacterium]|nr:hypothetical protein [Verrucomicrobiae bacterium]